MTRDEFLQKAKQAAMNVGLKWPGYVAAECALESRYGQSKLALEANNLLGMKAHKNTPLEQTLELPTKEYVDGQWKSAVARWMRYSDWEACLRDRQATLLALAAKYPHYAAALDAADGETFVREVSASWSTDPHRADVVLEVYRQHVSVLS